MFSQEKCKEWWKMQEGTKKLFPTDYDRFKEAMISAANDNSLPVALQLDDIRDYTVDVRALGRDVAASAGWESRVSI